MVGLQESHMPFQRILHVVPESRMPFSTTKHSLYSNTLFCCKYGLDQALMATTDVENADTNAFLRYDPRYGVLLCLKCGYAVQKSALDSHLLRHKIYREERKRLVASVSHLKILEPNEVAIPAPTSPALAYLTNFSGLKCTVPQCGHLTVSTKRMKLHWRQVHHSLELPIDVRDQARSVTLQTFFRGNKVRYFEVESTCTVDDDSPISHVPGQIEARDDVPHPYSPEDRPLSIMSTGQPANPVSPDGEPDMCMLRYFHHFVVITSRTLPFCDISPLKERYRQEAIVSRALQHSWLMHGLLAISACHMAMSTTDPESLERHYEYEAQYSSRFHLWIGDPVLEDLVKDMGDHVRCLLHLAQTALHRTPPTAGGDAPQKCSIALALRDCLRLDSVSIGCSLLGDGTTCTESSAEAPMDGLRTLQSRMFELLGRPANIDDALTVIKSIELLQDICRGITLHDDIEMCWAAAAGWLKNVPDHFHRMVDDGDPVALLIMTYWSTNLVIRVEEKGCWFLKGVVKASMMQVAERLAEKRHLLLPLMLDFEKF
jgi:hypothetical protein